MSARKGQKPAPRTRRFETGTPKGHEQAIKYLSKIASEGGWNSVKEFVNLYIIPFAANRLDALDRYNAKHAPKAKKPAKPKPKKMKAKKTAPKPIPAPEPMPEDEAAE